MPARMRILVALVCVVIGQAEDCPNVGGRHLREADTADFSEDHTPDTTTLADTTAYTGPKTCFKCHAPVKVGPVYAVRVTYGSAPLKTIDEIKKLMFGTDPSWGEVVKHSSWGKTTLSESDITWGPDLESTEDPNCWFRPQAENFVGKSVDTSQYNHVMIFLAGTNDLAQAKPTGKVSVYRSGLNSWNGMAHEIAHNWGLGHANAFTSKGSNWGFSEYADDHSIMGLQSQILKADFHAVSRYALGWLPQSQLAVVGGSSPATASRIRALHEGEKNDGAYLLMAIPCPKCIPGNPGHGSKHSGGTVYLSYRTQDPNSAYGVTDDIEQSFQKVEYRNKANAPLKMVDRVHVHFQAMAGGTYSHHSTELWVTLGQGAVWTVPTSDPPIYINVCETVTSVDKPSLYATVGASTTAADDATSKCAALAPNASPMAQTVADVTTAANDPTSPAAQKVNPTKAVAGLRGTTAAPVLSGSCRTQIVLGLFAAIFLASQV